MAKKKTSPPLDWVDVNSVPSEDLEDLVARLEAEKLRREIVRLRVEDEREQSSEAAQRRVRFYGSVGSSSVYGAIHLLDRYMVVEPGCDVLIEINSPGGVVFDGFALVDKIEELKSHGHAVTTRALGMAASMGMPILQCGDIRQMTRNAHLMVHEISSGSIGKYSEMQDEVELMNRLQQRYFSLVAEKSNLSVKQLMKRVERKDWWMSSDDALDNGFVDEVV